MAGLNKVMLIGNLGKDPEVRHLENGTTVANFSIATSEKWTDKGGEVHEKTEWHNIVVWRKLAEIVEKYVKKGTKVYVEGKLQTRPWEKDGVTRYTTEIVCNNLLMMGGNPNAQPASGAQPPQAQQVEQLAQGTGEELDDLPF